MTEYELDQACEKQKDCDGRCINCPLFAQYMNTQDDAR